ncbi:MAG: hypothetical protein JNL70_01615 [Saprospiraceae bacterium]|nr:hypothetical protein [Saprospiraceae bacterium]
MYSRGAIVLLYENLNLNISVRGFESTRHAALFRKKDTPQYFNMLISLLIAKVEWKSISHKSLPLFPFCLTG